MAIEGGATVAAGLIKQTVSKVEYLEEQKAQIAQNISDAFREAKSQGLDVSVLRQLIKLRKKNQAQVAEEEELLEVYRRALEE